MAQASAYKQERKRKLRERSETLFRRGLAKQADVGISPKYMNSYRRSWCGYSQQQWEALSKAWDAAHPIKLAKAA